MPLLPKKANIAGNNETLDDRSPVPAGDYLAHIVKTEFKQTKAKNGHYLSVQFKILDGPYKGRSLFTNLNLDNPNPVAVEIANKELNSICQAVGKEGVEDSDELLQLPMLVSVKVTEGDAQYPPANETTGYSKADGSSGGGGAPAPVEAGGSAPPVMVTEDEESDQEETAAPAGKLPWE